MLNKPGKKKGRPNREKRSEHTKERKGLKGLAIAQPALHEANSAITKPYTRKGRKRKSSSAQYELLKSFDRELIQRCRENGMSDGEIRKWMEES